VTYQLVRLERQQVLAAASVITDEELYQITYPYLEFTGTITRLAVELQLAAQEIDQLRQGKPNLIRTLQDNLGNVQQPTLILWSDQDRWFPLSHGERLRDRLPNAQLQMLPNCGHAASANCPGAVSHAVLEFLATQALGQQR
jgi:pimeloyl-ACP methyl ester carboxylesterase